jgi:hypothetical protein
MLHATQHKHTTQPDTHAARHATHTQLNLTHMLHATQHTLHNLTHMLHATQHTHHNLTQMLHATQHTLHNLTHMLPQYCASYNDIILLIVSTTKVTLARLNIDFLMMVRTDRNM